MSEDTIGAMVDAAKPDVKTEPVETKQEAPEAPVEKPDTKEEPKESFKTPWPKSAIDVMNRKDKKIAAAQKRIADFEKQLSDAAYIEKRLQELKPAPVADPNDPAPDISKYDDWVKYNRDLTAYNLRQLQKTQPKGEEPSQVDPQKAAWRQQRSQNVAEKAKELLTAHPDYLPVFHQTRDLLDDLPESTKDILLAVDNPALAVLQMAQDGTLDDLPHMAAPLAQKVIVKAMTDGAALLGATPQGEDESQAQPNVSRAPAPMKQSNTSKAGAKDPKNMSDDEFRSAFMSR